MPPETAVQKMASANLTKEKIMKTYRSTVASSLTLASLALGISLALTSSGCGPDEDFDINSLPEATEDDKADTTGSPLVWVRPSNFPIVCIRPPCATAQVQEVNGGKARLIYKYDWRALKMTAAEVKDAEANASKMLLTGRYASVKVMGESVTVLQLTRANTALSDKSSDASDKDRYYSVKADTTMCPQQPCPTMIAQQLGVNTLIADKWYTLDMSRLALVGQQESALMTELKAGKGYVSVVGTDGMVTKIGQVFRSLKSPALK